jgi:hypothetical protein
MPEFKKPKPSEMCPPGYHVVRAHERVCHSGTVTWVDAHVRKNHNKIKPGLLIENIYYLFWNSKKKYPSLKQIPDYPQGDQYDDLIQFWLDYWKSQGLKFSDDLHPLMLKALISVESDFNPNAKSKDPKSTASGLMQVTDQMVRILGGFPNKKGYIEARKNLIHIKYEDKLDPNVNTALGIRLLGHKYSQIPKGNPKNARNTLKMYHQWNKHGEKYADEVLFRYRKARDKK